MKQLTRMILVDVESKWILSLLTLTNCSRKSSKLLAFKKNFRKIIFNLTAIKFNSFQRKSINTLKDAPMGLYLCLSCIGNHQDIRISLMTIKTTKKRRKPKIQ